MSKKYTKIGFLFLILCFSSLSWGQNLLHYWNFNNNASVATITTPTISNISGASLTATISGISAIDVAGGTGQNFNVLNLNAQNGDPSGTHLRFNDPIGSALIFALPTTGFENTIVKFATRRSGSGAGTQVWSYSTDGTNYTFFSNVLPISGDPSLATVDFSAIAAADNNPNFKLKVEFQLAPGGNVGNNRFDNFTAEGTPFVAGPDTTPPTVSFFPVNGATGVAATVNPTITFNENVRLVNDDAITNTNVDAIVEVRLNNATGALVPFDATFSANTITILPTSVLENNQLYYVALLSNTIEDNSDNAIATLQSVTFTTPNPTVALSVSSNAGSEASATVITVTATASSVVSGNQTIDLGVNGTNITAGDYTLSNNSITILSGQTTGNVTFTIVDDAVTEGTESAVVTLSNPSSGIALGTTISQAITIIDNETALNIDLSTYVRVGRYDLPEPTRTAHPVNNLLCQEASAVAYNWDTDTLFITADGSTSVTQVSKTGQLIDTMTMAQGGSPQGTDFYDTEGITYIGNGQFVMSEERDRQLVKFTYAAGTTLTRANTQTVKIGTFVPNTGTEGLCFDPLTNEYIVLKEIDPIGIFQTGVDFNAGTATNGSPTTVNSVNLFNPALLGFTDVADVFALSNLPVASGQSLSPNLLVLSQENAQVVNIDRNGTIFNTLTIVSDPGNPLNAASQQHEGITMDNDGIIYIVNENGGGDIDHPQLWVYAPSSIANQAPTAITLTNTVPAIIENATTTPAVRVADILLTDDGLGTNTYTLTGVDANDFQITGSSLFIKPGTVLDFETKATYNVTINVDDTSVGNTPDASVSFVLSVTDLVNETPQLPNVTISEVAPWGSGNSPAAADWFEVTNNGATALNISGWKVDDSSNSFAASLPLTGITTIAPGESVIFIESSASNPAATVVANFKTLWFGTNPPANLQVGTYQGSGIGLSTGGDAVNVYDAAGVLQANVVFGASPTTLFKTFNNAIGLANTTISLLSEVGVNDAFVAVNDANEIGSPGSVGRLFVSEVAPWSSGNSPVGADWFEVTNTKAVAVDITGWKVDDSSQSPVAALPLNGITSIAPGESVIFIETNNLAGATTAFLNNWFGNNPSGSLQIGNYTGGGIGLSTGGDQVNLYNSSNVLQTSVLFGASPATAPYTSFDNKVGVNSLVTPITQFSTVGVNGAFVAVNSPTEIGSPGTITTPPCTPSDNITTITACDSYTWPVNGQTYTVSGLYTGTTTNCVTEKLALTINNSTTNGNLTITASGAYTWAENGQTYTTSGVYTHTTTNASGCQNVATLNLTISVNTFNLGTSCGATVSSLAVTVIAGAVPGASTYTFRITNLSTSASFVVNRPVNSFALSNYAGITLGTAYQVEVSVNGGVNYGTPCIVNTPAPNSTIGAQCGTTLTSMGQFVYATYVSSVTGYRFRVTNLTTNAVQEYDALSGQNRFTFNQLSAAIRAFGTTYSVEVALRNTDGNYLPYNAACNLTTPAFPTSEVIVSQCDTVATSNTQTISAVVVSGATGYRFELVNSGLAYSASIDRTVNNFNLAMFAGLQSGTTYTVRVAVRIAGVWGPLTGKPCAITTLGIAVGGTREIAANTNFAAIAYPNPFADNFMFNVTTTSDSTIQIRVYDMLGKQVENSNVEVTDMDNLQLGSSYPSGVYNVVISQAENNKTLRVIKR